MKLDSKTLKYILYALIVIFFLILIGQYIKPPDIEGLENNDDEKSITPAKAKAAATAREQEEVKNISENSSRFVDSLQGIKNELYFMPFSEVTETLTDGDSPFSASDISSVSQNFTTYTTKSIIDLSQNIANMKIAANLNNKSGIQNAGSIIDKYIENTRLLGINMMLNTPSMGQNFVKFYPAFVKDYKANMDFMQDLKAYTESGGESNGFGSIFGNATSSITRPPSSFNIFN